MHPRLRLLPFAVVLCAASPLAAPAHAATMYTDCLADAQAGAFSPACVTQSKLGPVSSPPPAGEYLDPLTGLVYEQTAEGFTPVGTGALPQFVEQTSVGSAACHSSDPTGCFATSCNAFTPVLHGTDCQESRVALVGCYDVLVTYEDRVVGAVPPFDPLPALSPRPEQSWSGCTPAPTPPLSPSLPIGGHGGVGAATPCASVPVNFGEHCFPWDVRDACLGGFLPGGCAWFQIANPGETPDTTSVERADGWTYECWYGTGVPPHPNGPSYVGGDPSFGPPVPEFVTATLKVTPTGSTVPAASVQATAQVC